ncbi:MAG: alpha/beta fold hydrolase [Thermoanaerobaculia bacterium]
MDANQTALVVDGRKLECLWFGPPPAHAPTLVFLHEGLGSASMWRDFPRQLADATGCGALVYSRAGYGASDPVDLPRPIRYMHDEAVVLAEVIESAAIRDAILVGHSDGASIALIYAGGARSSRLRALVLEAPHVFAEPIGLTSIAAMTDEYENTDLRDRLSRHHGANVDVAFRGWNDVWLQPEFRRWNIEEFLPSIDVPMLLLQGVDDQYGTWKQIEAIVQRVRGPVQTLLVRDCGHAPHRDQPEIVLAAMTNFILAVRP